MGTKNFNIFDRMIAWIRLKKVLPYIKNGSSILDFGCGYQAYLLHHIKNNIKSGIGLDYDVVEKKISQHIQTRKFKFVNRLPFINESFDTIILLAVLEHVDLNQISKLFSEFKRILKENGEIILTTPTFLGKAFLEFFAFKLHLISNIEVGDHKKYYTEKDIEDLCKKNNFKLVIYETFWMNTNSFILIKKDSK